MYKQEKIYCPQCKRVVATYDGRTKTPLITNCKRCEKRVVFDPVTRKIELKKIPPRETSSGVTFV